MCQSGKFSPWGKRDGGGKKCKGPEREKNERNRWQSRPSDGGRIISATFLGKGDPVSHGTGG